MQITCEEGKKTKMYLGHLASVPFKNEVLKLKSSRAYSPNPIGKDLLPLFHKFLNRKQKKLKRVLEIY